MDSQKNYAIHVQGKKGEEVTLSLSGRLETGNLNAFQSEAKTLLKERTPQKIIINRMNFR